MGVSWSLESGVWSLDGRWTEGKGEMGGNGDHAGLQGPNATTWDDQLDPT